MVRSNLEYQYNNKTKLKHTHSNKLAYKIQFKIVQIHKLSTDQLWRDQT
jgi:hypothetical protein